MYLLNNHSYDLPHAYELGHAQASRSRNCFRVTSHDAKPESQF